MERSMKYSYKNPWYDKLNSPLNGPFYSTDVEPVFFNGFELYHRVQSSAIHENVWDIVKDNVCVHQMCTLESCKDYLMG